MAEQFKARIEDFEADDIRAFYDSNVLRVWHLVGKDRTFRIERIQRITKMFRGEQTQRPVLRLSDSKGREVPLPLELNATNRKTISRLYGLKPKAWQGRLITLYPTECDSPEGTSECIRVRPYDPGSAAAPKGKQNKQGANVIRPRPEPVHTVVSAPGEDDDGPDYTATGTRQPGDDDAPDSEPPTGALTTDNLTTDKPFSNSTEFGA